MLQQGYLIFTDGSAYVYDAPSNMPIENLCPSEHRGVFFNLAVRRSQFGFVRGFTPPSDYETIYEFPPYEGTLPDACSVTPPPWTDIAWTVTVNYSDPGNTLDFSQDPGTGATQDFLFTSTVTDFGVDVQTDGVATYNGPDVDGSVTTSIGSPPGAFTGNLSVNVYQNGLLIANDNYDVGLDGDYTLPFSLTDTGGSDSTILVEAHWQFGVSFPFTPGFTTFLQVNRF